MINDKVYNVLKWVLITFVPYFVSYLASLSDVFGWDTAVVVQVITLTAGFVGSILGISSITYYKDKATQEESKVADPYQLVESEDTESEE